MTLIKADRTDIFFQYKQVLNPKHADRKFHKRSPYAFSLKKKNPHRALQVLRLLYEPFL